MLPMRLKEKKRKVLSVHTLKTEHHQFPPPSQPKRKNGDMSKKKGFPHGKQETKKNKKKVKIKQFKLHQKYQMFIKFILYHE